MNLLLVGMSHHTARLELRERFVVPELQPVLEKLHADPSLDEVTVLSTCNRVEILVWTRDMEAAHRRLRRSFERELTEPCLRPCASELEAALYHHLDGAAVSHLFRVACALDSMVVGEPQILGQVKQAYRAAVAASACGPVLGRLYQRAFATAKRVRNETRLAERPVSVARVAVTLTQQIFEKLEGKSALLIGAGKMIELALDALRQQGLAAVRVADRTRNRATELAVRKGASAHGLDELPALLPHSDVVLCGIGATRPLLDAKLVRDALRARRGRPIFLIDLGVPRNVAVAVSALDGAHVYDLDDIQSVAEVNSSERRIEAGCAAAIVNQELRRFEGWLRARAAAPTIRALCARAEAIRQREIARGLAGRKADAAEQQRLAVITRAITNKLLHAPVSKLREELGNAEGLDHLEAARVLFALDDPDAPGADADADADADDAAVDADREA